MTQFEINKVYSMRSACDYDCIWSYKVIKRTACTVTLQQLHRDGKPYGKTINCRISKGDSAFYNAEAVSPLGKYSMSPILVANR